MRLGGFPDFADDFRRAVVVNAPHAAPDDETPILARNAAGDASGPLAHRRRP